METIKIDIEDIAETDYHTYSEICKLLVKTNKELQKFAEEMYELYNGEVEPEKIIEEYSHSFCFEFDAKEFVDHAKQKESSFKSFSKVIQ